MIEPTAEQRAEWESWIAEHEAVRPLAEKYPPWQKYKLLTTGQVGYLFSYSENGHGHDEPLAGRGGASVRGTLRRAGVRPRPGRPTGVAVILETTGFSAAFAHGDPATVARFVSRLAVVGECWEWIGTLNRKGYGCFGSKRFDGKAETMAHRFAYGASRGVDPERGRKRHIDHLCKNPACQRPDHLEEVTSWENNRRSDSTSARNILVTHCPRGHEYAGNNLRINPAGKRQCRQCDSFYNRRAREVAAAKQGKTLQLYSALKTHCPQGHPYAGDNLVIQRSSRGGWGRKCAICIRAQNVKTGERIKRERRARRAVA